MSVTHQNAGMPVDCAPVNGRESAQGPKKQKERYLVGTVFCHGLPFSVKGSITTKCFPGVQKVTK